MSPNRGLLAWSHAARIRLIHAVVGRRRLICARWSFSYTPSCFPAPPPYPTRSPSPHYTRWPNQSRPARTIVRFDRQGQAACAGGGRWTAACARIERLHGQSAGMCGRCVGGGLGTGWLCDGGETGKEKRMKKRKEKV
jgi:hypothetical protein